MQEDAAGRHRRPIEEKMEEASPFVAAQKSGQMKRRPDQRGGPSARPNSPRELGKEEIGANRGSRSSSFAVPEAGERKRRSPAPRNEPKNRESDQKTPPFFHRVINVTAATTARADGMRCGSTECHTAGQAHQRSFRNENDRPRTEPSNAVGLPPL